MNITIVVPAHNRGEKLIATVELLLANDAAGFDEVEIIVIDDGSIIPAGPLINGLATSPPFRLRCIRIDPNLGPAGARNAGFRCARGEVVLFVDDDILSPPDLIRRHVEAHRVHTGSVVCGTWRNVVPEPMTPLYRYTASLGIDDAANSTEEFVPTAIISSGHISMERAMFPTDEGLYRDGLTVPAAEEYELSYRLRDRGIPVLSARRIVAMHDHPVTLDSMCRQTFKHAMGCAEAAVKCPAILELEEVRHIMATNGPLKIQDSPKVLCKKSVKRLLASSPTLGALLAIIKRIEQMASKSRLLPPLYRMIMGLYFFAGVRAGIRCYTEPARAPDLRRMARQAGPSPLV